MAETRAAEATPTYTITHEDGSVVTPQEMYNAFMSGPVILETPKNGGGFAGTVVGVEYAGTPDNVTGCIVRTSGDSITIGVM